MSFGCQLIFMTSSITYSFVMLTIDGFTSFLQIMDHRVLTRILKIGVKKMFTRKVWSFTKLLYLELLKKLESECCISSGSSLFVKV